MCTLESPMIVNFTFLCVSGKFHFEISTVVEHMSDLHAKGFGWPF
jgi:hypothetical protein